MMENAARLVAELGLRRHPEGGYYAETYRSQHVVGSATSNDRFPDGRPFCTAILFLLSGDDFSALHRLKSDELWHFHHGTSLTIHAINPDGALTQRKLGADFTRGESFQLVVHAGCWFGATLDHPQSYALTGCTVSPGFEFRDFEIGSKDALLAAFPQHRQLIEQLTR